MKYSIYLVAFLSLLSVSSSAPQSFNVNSYGAKGDGVSDSTAAFLAAWKAACGAVGDVEIYVPKGNYYLNPLTFSGKCKGSILTVRIDGTLLAPQDYMVIAKEGRWIVFDSVENVVIQGGRLVGRGKYLFQCESTHDDDPTCPFGGRMLDISKSNNVKINNVTSINSQGFHFTIEDSQNVEVFGARLRAPWNSPNTDGIHVADSDVVSIVSSNIQTGDDCVSLGPGSQSVWIEDILCGPGHGISIGSLGSTQNEAAVKNVTATNIRFYSTQNGYRIKTWAKPNEVTVSNIHFLDARMSNVSNPVIIDQTYCPHNVGCSSQPSYARIIEVEYQNIHGTSASEVAIKFDCSAKYPCSGLYLKNVTLEHAPSPAKAEIQNAHFRTTGVVKPSPS